MNGAKTAMADEMTVEIWRGATDGAFQTYRVPRQASQTVLDVVTHVQRNIDPSLFYRFACRVGMCGSCAMTVNGKPRWTCRTLVSRVETEGALRIGPLSNLRVIRDLACDMTDFFEKWQRASGRFVPTDPDAQSFAKVPPSSRDRQAADAGIECIGCGVCYSACDVVAWRSDYLGPAALNRAWTLVNDERDGDRPGHLRAAAADAGCHACHSHQGCATYCPKSLNPTASIAGLKRASFSAALKGKL